MRDPKAKDDRQTVVLRMVPKDWARLAKAADSVGMKPTMYVRVAMWRAIRAEEAAAGAAQAPEVWGLIRDTIMAAEQERLREDEKSKA